MLARHNDADTLCRMGPYFSGAMTAVFTLAWHVKKAAVCRPHRLQSTACLSGFTGTLIQLSAGAFFNRDSIEPVHFWNCSIVGRGRCRLLPLCWLQGGFGMLSKKIADIFLCPLGHMTSGVHVYVHNTTNPIYYITASRVKQIHQSISESPLGVNI